MIKKSYAKLRKKVRYSKPKKLKVGDKKSKAKVYTQLFHVSLSFHCYKHSCNNAYTGYALQWKKRSLPTDLTAVLYLKGCCAEDEASCSEIF